MSAPPSPPSSGGWQVPHGDTAPVMLVNVMACPAPAANVKPGAGVPPPPPAGAGVRSFGWPEPNMLAVPCTVQFAAALQVGALAPPPPLTFVTRNGVETSGGVWLFQVTLTVHC